MGESTSSCVFDSSVLVALFAASDVHHEKAKEVFDQVKYRAYIPYAALLETATVLAYKHSKAHADRFIEFVTNDERCSIAYACYEEECREFIVVSAKISFADVAIISCALRLEMPLVTFDRQMRSLSERLAKVDKK